MATFDEVRQWLARNPELDDAFRQLVDSDGGTGARFQSVQTFGSDQIVSSNGDGISVERSSSSVLGDLESRGLVRLSRHGTRGNPQYELSADARDFERWRQELHSVDPSPETAPRPAATGQGPEVFVSYSRDDQQYVSELVTFLEGAGLTSWIDRLEIAYGDRWEDAIKASLDACKVLVVVMTPSSEGSPWVKREIARAERNRKPILPLLLEGEVFFSLSDYHHVAVAGGKMPPERWLEEVERLVREA